MQNLIKSLTNILLIGAIITNILLYNTIKQMSPFIKKTEPSKISEKPVSTTLNVKSEFIYFEGNIIEDGKKIDDIYQFDTKYPNEIWNGYVSLSESYNGDKYFIWSKNKLLKSDIIKIKGWFVSNSNKWQINDTKDYCQVLYPIVERK